jgi:hypothetical protein
VLRKYMGISYERFWKRELNIEDLSMVDRVRSELLDAGVFDVPAYVANGEMFIGREHLPMIRDRLASA